MSMESRRVAVEAHASGAAWSVLSAPDAVVHATGVAESVECGPSPFEGGPDLAIVAPDGAVALITPRQREERARVAGVDEVVTYTGYTGDTTEPLLDNYLDAVKRALAQLRVGGSVAVQPGGLPDAVGWILRDAGLTLIDGGHAFEAARSVKTPRELALLREAARIATVGQLVARSTATPGMAELELFAAIRLAMEREAGERVSVAGDVLSGSARTSAVGGWPGRRILESDDLVITDLAPRVNGYWADSCGTIVLGEPSAELARMQAAVASALQAGVEAVRPGQRACDLDRVVRDIVEGAGYSYPHHTGHGIGTSVHEFPRIVPGESGRLHEGMVILLEPGAYVTGVGGVRLEWMLEVTHDGAALLTDFPLAL